MNGFNGIKLVRVQSIHSAKWIITVLQFWNSFDCIIIKLCAIRRLIIISGFCKVQHNWEDVTRQLYRTTSTSTCFKLCVSLHLRGIIAYWSRIVYRVWRKTARTCHAQVVTNVDPWLARRSSDSGSNPSTVEIPATVSTCHWRGRYNQITYLRSNVTCFRDLNIKDCIELLAIHPSFSIKLSSED